MAVTVTVTVMTLSLSMCEKKLRAPDPLYGSAKCTLFQVGTQLSHLIRLQGCHFFRT